MSNTGTNSAVIFTTFWVACAQWTGNYLPEQQTIFTCWFWAVQTGRW